MNKFDKEIEDLVKKVIEESVNKNSNDLISKVKNRILESEMDEGNAFTKMLARTKRGGKFSLKGKKYRDTSSYDADLYEEDEMEEGNAFTGALAKAKKEGKDKFEVDGKTFDVKEVEDRDMFDDRPSKVIGVDSDIDKQRGEGKYMSDDEISKFVKNALKKSVTGLKSFKDYLGSDKNEDGDDEYADHMWIGEAKKEGKFIQKATEKMEKKGTTGKFASWCKKEGLDKDGEVTKKCIDKAMKSDDPNVVKMANFAKNIGGFKGAKHESVQMSEADLIELIEEMVNEAKIPGVYNTDKANNATGKDAKDYYKEVTKKMKEYLKTGSKGKFEENPKHFPKGNGELAKMDKKAYEPSEAVEEYVDAFSHPGQTNLNYDEIGPDEKKIEKYLKGDKTTGNSQEYANAVETETGEKMYKNYKENLYGAEQANASYKRQPQPVDMAGENKPNGKLQRRKSSAQKAEKILNQLESMDEKGKTKINEEIEKMKNMVSYKTKTQ